MKTENGFDIYRATGGGQDYIHVIFDRSQSRGVVRFTHECTMTYDMNTGEWKGGEICAGGWVDFDKNEIDEIVKKFDLDTKLMNVLNNNQ